MYTMYVQCLSNYSHVYQTYTYMVLLMWLTILELWCRHCALDHHPQHLELEPALLCLNQYAG